MNQLTIKLTGEIQSSNFAEWKNDLIKQIQSTNSQLVTDDDFVTAARHVKLFKAAEKSLKDAKQSAINQAADIQQLFTAIDEVSAKAREARLVLERQIKTRKQEIKEELIASGIDRVHESIRQQNSDFQLVNHASFIDYRRFETAVKGKAGIRGIEIAIDSLCATIKQEISLKAAEVNHNAIALGELSSQHKVLFQDRASLLALSKQELELTIDKRIALQNEENSRVKAERAVTELEKIENVELNLDSHLTPEGITPAEKSKYRLIIDILSSKDDAIEIARSIKQSYTDNPLISGIKLSRDHGGNTKKLQYK